MLRHEFGISAHEREHVIPDWEIQMLLNRHVHHLKRKATDS